MIATLMIKNKQTKYSNYQYKANIDGPDFQKIKRPNPLLFIYKKNPLKIRTQET